jgi:hypothetical protein
VRKSTSNTNNDIASSGLPHLNLANSITLNKTKNSFLPFNKNSDAEDNGTSGDELMSNPILEYFRENALEKELFDDLLVVRRNVQNLENEITEMKENQMKFYKIKFEFFKSGSTRQSIHYDLMYSCLFGNHVVL